MDLEILLNPRSDVVRVSKGLSPSAKLITY